MDGALTARNLPPSHCRHMHWVTATSYVVAQIVGAIFAAGLLYGTIPGAANSDLGALRLNPGECCPLSRAAPASEQLLEASAPCGAAGGAAV